MCIRFNFWKSLFFCSLARHRACPDLTAAPTAWGCRSERFSAGLAPSLPDFATPRSGRTDLGEEGGGGAANTRTQTLTCSRAERRKPGAERTAWLFLRPVPSVGLQTPCPAPGRQPCCSGGRPPLPAPVVRGRQDHAAEGVSDLHAAHRGRGKRRSRPCLGRSRPPAPCPGGPCTLRPATLLLAARKPGRTLPPKPEGWRGGRKGNCCFHLSSSGGRRRWVGRWAPGGPF